MSRLWKSRAGSINRNRSSFSAYFSILLLVALYGGGTFAIGWLVPEDGNLPRGVFAMAFLTVPLAVYQAISARMVARSAERQAALEGDPLRDGSPVWDVVPAVKSALREFRLGPYTVLLLLHLAFAVFALAVPTAWFDRLGLAVTSGLYSMMTFLLNIALIGGLPHLLLLIEAEPESGSAAQRRRHRRARTRPFTLLAAAFAALPLGLLLIEQLVPSVGTDRAALVTGWALWLVVWYVALRVIIARLRTSATDPKSDVIARLWREATGPKAAGPHPAPPQAAAPTAPKRAKPEHPSLPVPRLEPVPLWGARPVYEDRGGGLLTWDEGSRDRVVRSSAQLHAELLRLHLSTVTVPRTADFTPESGMTVRISLGEERTVLLTDPDDPALSRVVTMSGLAKAFADPQVHTYPSHAYLPFDLAMEILRRYCATGELPGAVTATDDVAPDVRPAGDAG
ncbi:Imm1 family immunity protein [Catellatospora aurea]|uniref:Imm1 family immunity protein n=1 Tax=Catellatospora aurea TaxID=1337874 RepID=A0ABW2H8D8_9ACTN